MSIISFHCPGCHAVLKTTNPELTGRSIRCPRCGHAFAMPTEAEREALAASLRPAPPIPPPSDAAAAPAAMPTPRRRRRVIAMYATCAALIVVSTAAAAFFLWDRVTHGTRNAGSGRENALAYVPGDSNVVLRINADHWSASPELRAHMERYIRSFGSSPFFLDCDRAVGLDFVDLFHQSTYALRMPPGGSGPGRRPLATTMIIRSRVPFQQRKVAHAFPGAVAEKVHGQTIYRINETTFQTLYMPSDRTIVLTNVAPMQLITLVESDGMESRPPPDMAALVTRIEKEPFWVVMAFDGSVTPDMNRSVESFRSVAPAEWQALLDALPAARAVGLWSDLEGNNIRTRVGLECANESTAGNVARAFRELVSSNPLRKTGYTAILSRTTFPVSFRQVGSALVQEGEFSNDKELAVGRVAVDVGTFRLVLRDLQHNLGLRRQEMMPGPER